MNLMHEGVLDPNEPDLRDEKREAEEARRERETLANIVAEMRREVRYGKDTYCGKRVIRRMEDVRVMQFCDRIEAAWKRDEERAIEHATRHAEAVARDNCRDCIHNPNGKNYEPVGNAAAMLEALNDIVGIAKIALNVNCVGNSNDSELWNIIDKCKSALSAPPRQCDVGTAEEQAVRFRDMCNKYYDDEYPCNNDCPLASLDIIHGFPRCQAYWAQTPYEAQEGGAE